MSSHLAATQGTSVSNESTTLSIRWFQPTLMVGLWLLGIAFSVSHHSYYADLDGHVANDQDWVIRVGTGLAFLVKTCFASSLVIAMKQLVWTRVRDISTSVKGIDALFAITSDPMSIFVADVWAKLAAAGVLAILLWSMPLAAVVAPASISVTTASPLSTQLCEVPVLNFDKKYDWKYQSPQLALAKFNASRYMQPKYPNDNADAWKGHLPREIGYAGPTPVAEKLLRRVFIGSEILPFAQVCGPNCTYITTVPGVGYQCSSLDWKSNRAGFVNASDLFSPRAYLYKAPPMLDRELIGFVVQQETINNEYKTSLEYFSCVPHKLLYKINVTYTNNIRQLDVVQEEILEPIPWPVFIRNQTLSATYAETNFWAYQALADVLAQNLRRGIWLPMYGETTSSTLLSYASLVDQQTTDKNPNATVFAELFYPKLNFRNRVSELVRNLSISLLAEPNLHIYDKATVECQITTYTNVWTYNPGALWPAYAAALWVCTVGVVIGALSLYRNGCNGEMSFSRVLCTTRNRALDEATAGARFGDQPLPKDLAKLQLQFGELADEKHVAFGVEGQIIPLRRGRCETRLA
ncbi:hypothetical protein NM208_g11904 [Fusarium decemcellulare]|uniref:Uncharacterized protein n=1 Tax=Fusarium decemcellulare TaxID=57161 RepID=A0ACC1RUF2_9HYPO|nr:hypothetical protein NM208_g11904 [Fusarium decemcellulare]